VISRQKVERNLRPFDIRWKNVGEAGGFEPLTSSMLFKQYQRFAARNTRYTTVIKE
jgi:hypothetical protein